MNERRRFMSFDEPRVSKAHDHFSFFLSQIFSDKSDTGMALSHRLELDQTSLRILVDSF